ncbi:hypothetical protein ACA910_009535 [Epithemia clementina (nom. ined.)]
MSTTLANRTDEKEILDKAYDSSTTVPPAWNASDPLQETQSVNYGFCELFLGRDLFQPPPFQASQRLIDTNQRAVRFGGSNNMITLLEGTEQEQEAYLVGLVASSILVAFFFAAWTVVVIVLKFVSYRWCGFFCGRFIRPNPNKFYRQQQKQQQRNNKKATANSMIKASSRNQSKALPAEATPQDEQYQQGNALTLTPTSANGLTAAQVPTPGNYDDNYNDNDKSNNNNDQGMVGNDDDDDDASQSHIQDEYTFDNEYNSNNNDDNHNYNDNTGDYDDNGEPYDDDNNVMGVVQDDDHDHEHDEAAAAAWLTKACHAQDRRIFRVRIFLVMACLCICVAGILFCTYGTKYISQSFDSVAQGLRHLQDLCAGAMALIDQYTARQNETAQELADIFGSVNGACPAVREQICTNVSSLSSSSAAAQQLVADNCDFSDIPVISESLEVLFNITYRASTYVTKELTSMRQDLQKSYDNIDDLLNSNVSLAWAFWAAFSFVVALIVCCVILIVGILCHRRYGKLNKWQRCFRHRVIFPLFCVLVFLSFAFAIVFIITSIGASDWCIDSPDAKVSYVLQQAFDVEEETFKIDDIDSVIYAYAQYYVNNCPTNGQPIQPNASSERVRSILDSVQNFARALGEVDIEQWQVVCGSDLTALTIFQDLVQELMCLLSLTLEDVNRFFWCRNWSPVYTIFMYEAICYDAQTGLSWVASTTFAIVFCAFIVFLLRAGAFDPQEEDEYLREMRRCRVCCYSTVTCACCRKNATNNNADMDNDNLDHYNRNDQHGDNGGANVMNVNYDEEVVTTMNDAPPPMAFSPSKQQVMEESQQQHQQQAQKERIAL